MFMESSQSCTYAGPQCMRMQYAHIFVGTAFCIWEHFLLLAPDCVEYKGADKAPCSLSWEGRRTEQGKAQQQQQQQQQQQLERQLNRSKASRYFGIAQKQRTLNECSGRA